MKNIITFPVLLFFLAFTFTARAQNNDGPTLRPFDPAIVTSAKPASAKEPSTVVNAPKLKSVKVRNARTALPIDYMGRHYFSLEGGFGSRDGRSFSKRRQYYGGYLEDSGVDIDVVEPEKMNLTYFGAFYAYNCLRFNDAAVSIGARYLLSGRSGNDYSYSEDKLEVRDIAGYERIHYIGGEVGGTVRFGRFMWYIGTGAGYIRARTMISQMGRYLRVRGSGAAMHLSTSLECKITGWLGIGATSNLVLGYPKDHWPGYVSQEEIGQWSVMGGLRFYLGK